jgi:hypothetical protein
VIVWLVFLLGFGYLVVALVYAARQEQLFFKPRGELAATPAAAGLPFEDVTMVADDGVHLHGWWLPAPVAANEPEAAGSPGRGRTLLYLHGAAVDLGGRVDALAFWSSLGFAILAVDYRGYGRSEGRPTEAGLYADAHAAWRWLVDERGVAAEHVVVAAESLGVAVATELGRHVRPAGLVLEAGFTDAAAIAARRYPWLPVRQMMRLRLDTAAAIAGVRSPTLIVHSVEDDLVPISMGRRLQQRAGRSCDFLSIRGAHARACVGGGDRYRRGVVRWLEKLPETTP